MRNLAGVERCDSYIVRELLEAGINLVPCDVAEAEVTASFYGKLNGWTFHRAWYYWVVKPIEEKSGLPLELAIPLYENHGKYVRVAGHCHEN